MTPGPTLEVGALNPGADTELTLGNLDLFLDTAGAFAASTALIGDF